MPSSYARLDELASRDPVHFANALAALEGARFALTAGASKVMRFMLEDAGGCDAVIAPASYLEISFAWNRGRHQYFAECAPPIVSALVEMANAAPPAHRIRGSIGPALHDVPNFIPWRHGRRRLWLDATAGEIQIRVRDDDPAFTDLPPEAFPDPIAYPYTVIDLMVPLRCPHCDGASTSYRKLSDGSLVCLVCARSFTYRA